MHLRKLSLLAMLAAAMPLTTQAETMDYSFAELAYVDTELDDDIADVDGDGFALRGSLAINDMFFAFVGYQDLGFDFGIDATAIEVGGGAHWALRDKLDIVGRVGIIKTEVELDRAGIDQDEDGFLIGARLRGEVAPRFELEGGFDYADLDDTGDSTSIVGEARYFFMDQLSGGVLLEIGEDTTTIAVGARWTF